MLFGFHGAFIVLTALRYRRRALGWPVAVLAVVVAYLPWVGPAARQVTRLRDTPDFWQGALSLWFVAQHAFAAFAVGFGGALERYALVLVAFVAAFVLGAAVVAWRGLLRGRSGDLLVFLYLALPTAMLYVVVASNPKFADRYLILVVPPFLLLLARGVVGIGELGARLRQRVAPLGLALVGLSALFAVGMVGISAREGLRVYRDEPYAKEDYRGAVAYLIDHWQTGDAVLLMLDSADVFEYYSHGKLTHYPMNPTDDLQFAATELNKVVAKGHGRLWLLMWNPDWADPSGAVRAMMDETLERVPLDLESFFHLPVRLYSLADHPTFDARPQPPTQLDTRFGDALKLLGADLGGDAPTPSGSTRQVRLFWEPLRQIPDELSVSLRLTRGGREWWRWDGPPAAHSYPTTYWKPGRSVRGGFKVEVPAGTPPGEYDLSLVVYNPREKAPLIARTGDRSDAEIRLGTFRVGPPAVPPAPAALPIPSRAPVDVDGAALVASELRQQNVDAGGTLDLAVGWRLTAAPSDRLEEFWLIDAAGKAWPLGAAPPVDGQYPTTAWRTGEVVVDRLTVAVPPGAAAGAATLRTTLRPAAGVGSPDRAAEVGRVEVRSRVHEMRPPSPRASLQARVGDFAELVGVDAPAEVARGETAKLALYWRGRAETRESYTVFVHLIGADDKPVAQRDAVPGDGTLPTTGWVVGEYLRDEYALAVPSDAPPGSYRVAVGMYDRRTGQRLPVETAVGRDPGKRAVVATVVVR
jgi:hypothetical protein